MKELCYVALESKHILEDYLRLLKLPSDDIDRLLDNIIDDEDNYNFHTILNYFGPYNMSDVCDYICHNILSIAEDSYIHYSDHYTFDEYVSAMLSEIDVSENTIQVVLNYKNDNDSYVLEQMGFDKLSISDDNDMDMGFDKLTI